MNLPPRNAESSPVSDDINTIGSITPVLLLTQARISAISPSTQTLTYTFNKPINSFKLDIYDLTYMPYLPNNQTTSTGWQFVGFGPLSVRYN